MTYAILIPPLPERPRPVEYDGYLDIRGHVGGIIDVVRGALGPRDLFGLNGDLEFSFYVHDEGLIEGLPMNVLASALGRRPIAGPALVVGTPDHEGNDTDCPEEVGHWLGFHLAVLDDFDYFDPDNPFGGTYNPRQPRKRDNP